MPLRPRRTGAEYTLVQLLCNSLLVTLSWSTWCRYTYGADIEIADLRMYHHGTGAAKPGPLTEANIKALAYAPTTGVLDEGYKCLALTDPRLADAVWSDSTGHDCGWYSSQSKVYPEVCQLQAAARNCPISCKSKQECFTREEPPKRYFAWDRTRLISMRADEGTLCLGSHLERAKVVDECRQWHSSGGRGAKGGRGVSAADDKFLQQWLDSMALDGPQPRKGRRVNITVCDELEQAIDVHCGFDIEQVRAFTRDVKANGGDFSFAFWVKPVGDVSMLGDTGRFFPHINFFSTLSPPQHQLHVGYWVNPNGEARINTNCVNPNNKASYWNVEHKKASNSDWTFIAISHSNVSSPQETNVFTNLGKNKESADAPTCLYDPESFFNALEVNYPMLISPIMMVPKALPSALVQQEYLKNVEEMSIRVGPTVENAVRVATRVPVEKRDFGPRSTLMASPIIFQTRVTPTGNKSFCCVCSAACCVCCATCCVCCATCCVCSAACCVCSAATCSLRVVTCSLLVRCLFVAGCCLFVACCYLFVACSLRVVTCSLLVASSLLHACSCGPRAPRGCGGCDCLALAGCCCCFLIPCFSSLLIPCCYLLLRCCYLLVACCFLSLLIPSYPLLLLVGCLLLLRCCCFLIPCCLRL